MRDGTLLPHYLGLHGPFESTGTAQNCRFHSMLCGPASGKDTGLFVLTGARKARVGRSSYTLHLIVRGTWSLWPRSRINMRQLHSQPENCKSESRFGSADAVLCQWRAQCYRTYLTKAFFLRKYCTANFDVSQHFSERQDLSRVLGV